ncbi:TPR repeat [Microscilla marina ATCC 23134]|uniref:TPR repeat n=2 Tax=Microscilla marina TaxID=1027 RepID=A1ZZ78_MICM2|nr:TPR repeat [Microscilla marina ATCC 23134]
MTKDFIYNNPSQETMRQLYKLCVFSAVIVMSCMAHIAQAQDTPAKLLKQGKEKSAAKEYKAAIALFDQAIKLDGKFKKAYYHRGMAHFKLEDLQEAVADFNRIIAIDAKNAMAYAGRAQVKYEAGDNEGACEDIKKAGELGFAESSVYIKKYCR